MKRSVKWLIVVVIAVVVIAGVLRAVSARRAQQQPVSAPAESVVELAPTDVVRAGRRDLAAALPVSGPLKA
ncbi:MAG: efflux transporter periplasmic adaptor subunit, partial [Rubrivivax sp.]